MGEISPAGIAEIAWGAYDHVTNRNNPRVVDRRKLPFWSWLQGRAEVEGTNGGVITVKLKKRGDDEIQHHSGRDFIDYKEQRIDYDLVFPYAYSSKGLELLHEELENQGFVILANGPRGRSFGTKNSADDALRLVDTIKEKIEEFFDSWDRGMDKVFHRDGTQDPLAPLGLDAILPTVINPGDLYGGQPRDTDIARHQIALDLDASAGGDLMDQFENLTRDAELRARDYEGSNGIDVWFAGAKAIQAIKQWHRVNGIHWNADIAGQDRIDAFLGDPAVSINNVMVYHDPTFELLDQEDAPATQWTYRVYGINSSTFKLAHPKNKLKHFSAPLDNYDQDITRMRLAGRHVLCCEKTNGNIVATIDPLTYP